MKLWRLIIKRPLYKEAMAQILSQLTLETIQDAKAKNQFILLTTSGSSRINITDARNLWITDPSIIFQTGYRVAGTPSDVSNIMISLGFTQNEIENLINSSITSNNYYNEFAPIYNEEMTNYNIRSRSIIESNLNSPGAKLFDIMVAVNPEVLVNSQNTGQNKTKSSTSRARKPVNLYDIISKLPSDKVLDVSNIDIDGHGYTRINRPKRGKKHGTPNIPIVSSDFYHYLLAIKLLPGGEQKYSADLAYMRALFGGSSDVPIPSTVNISTPTISSTSLPSISATSLPSISTQGPQPVYIPQVEPITPSPIFPIFSKSDKKKRREAKKLNDSIMQNVIPTGLNIPVPGTFVPVPVPNTFVPVPVPNTFVPVPTPTFSLSNINFPVDDNSDDEYEDNDEGEDNNEDEDNEFSDEENEFAENFTDEFADEEEEAEQRGLNLNNIQTPQIITPIPTTIPSINYNAIQTPPMMPIINSIIAQNVPRTPPIVPQLSQNISPIVPQFSQNISPIIPQISQNVSPIIQQNVPQLSQNISTIIPQNVSGTLPIIPQIQQNTSRTPPIIPQIQQNTPRTPPIIPQLSQNISPIIPQLSRNISPIIPQNIPRTPPIIPQNIPRTPPIIPQLSQNISPIIPQLSRR